MTLDLLSLICPCGKCKAGERVPPAAALVTLLTTMNTSGTQLTITSGVRCKPHNMEVGGAPTSLHLSGLAADLAVADSAQRFAIVRAAIMAGARFVEVCDKHVHVDMRPNLTRQLVTGVSR